MDKKLDLINLQLITTIIFLGTLCLSIYLTWNEKQKHLNKRHLDSKTSKELYNTNRIVIIILLFIYLYISYQDYKLGSKNNINKKILIDELVASSLAVITGLIILYDSFLNLKIDNLEVENPEL